MRTARPYVAVIAGAIVALAAGCVPVGPNSVRSDQVDYADAMSEAIKPEEIGYVAMVKRVADGVKVAMERAGITDPKDVHYVQTKTPLLTIQPTRVR